MKSYKKVIGMFLLCFTVCFMVNIIEVQAKELTELTTGVELRIGDKLYSQNRQYYATMQNNGKVVVKRTSDDMTVTNVTAFSGSASDSYYAMLNSNGNLEIYSYPGFVTWRLNTPNQNGIQNVIKVMNDGRFVILSQDTCIWETKAPAEESIIETTELTSGVKFKVGDKLYSQNRQYYATLLNNGKAIVKKTSNESIIAEVSSYTGSISNSYYAMINSNGNFEVYNASGSVAWRINTPNQNGIKNVIKVLNDGSFAVLSQNLCVWETKSPNGGKLECGDILYINHKMYSENGKYYTMLQRDANIGVFRSSDGGAVYGILAAGQPESNKHFAILQGDGNFAIYNASGVAIWCTYAVNQNGVKNVAKVLNDGTLAVLSENLCVWETKSPNGGTLECGDILYINHKMYSENGKYYTMLQRDANIGVFRSNDGGAVYGILALGQPESNKHFAILQGDGNFAIYNASGVAIWCTYAVNQNGVKNVAKVLNDGTLAVLSENLCVWETKSPNGGILECGDILYINHKMYSENGAYYTMLQRDANIGVFRSSDGGAIAGILAAGLPESNKHFVILQGDGNFAIYNASGVAIWCTYAVNRNGVKNVVKVSNDGRLQVLSSGSSIWSTNEINVVSNIRSDLIAYASQFLGNRYVYGGTSLTNGTDCSGFVMRVFEHFGYSLSRTSGEQSKNGSPISINQLQPGDLLFYGTGGVISHVAIYFGDGQIIHAANENQGIIISNAFYTTPICARRIINN